MVGVNNSENGHFYINMGFNVHESFGGRGGSMVERRTPEREVKGSNPTNDV